MKIIKRLLIPKGKVLKILKGEMSITYNVDKKEKITIRESKHKNYIDDPDGMFIELIFEKESRSSSIR